MAHLYIRHTVGGRLFLDSIQHDTPFTIEQELKGWIFTIYHVKPTIAEQMLLHRYELNIFVISEDRTSEKSWYYTRDGKIKYDESTQTIVIYADYKIDYPI